MLDPQESKPAQTSARNAAQHDSFDAIAACCNAFSHTERATLAAALVRAFARTQTPEQRLGEFFEALAAGTHPTILDEVKRDAASGEARADIPDQRGSPASITWARAEGKVVSMARLTRLPSGLKLAEDFPEPIRYDVDSKQLQYRGYMSKSSYDFLRSLHRDVDFQRALEVLFRDSSSAWSSPARTRGVGGLIKKWLGKFRGPHR